MAISASEAGSNRREGGKARFSGNDVGSVYEDRPLAERNKEGGVFTGFVSDLDLMTGTVSVKVNGEVHQRCSYLPALFSSFLGTGAVTLPPIGSNVMVMKASGQCFVIGSATNATADTKVFQGRVGDMPKPSDSYRMCKGAKTCYRTKDGSASGSGNFLPKGDMVPGEVEFTDNCGTAVRVLYGLAQLCAGDQAKVEACLFNDMVRIVDNHFAHHTAGGDMITWEAGGTTTWEEHCTSYGFEADGKKEPSEPFTVEESGVGVYKAREAPRVEEAGSVANATGRWRLSTYKGYLGDMIHTFVTKPTDTVSTTMKNAIRQGQFRAWVGTDGTCMVQAAGGVHVEVTPNIIIPEIHMAWNDPEKGPLCDITSAKDKMYELSGEFDKLWGNGPDWKDLGAACWQMNAYTRYLTSYHSLARFLMMEKETEGKYCKVPSIGQFSATPTAGDKAREKSNKSGDNPYKGRASVTIDPSGSITAHSNGIASVILSGGNIQLAAAGNIEINAGGTLSLNGKYVTSKSVFDTEITSSLGKITQKAKTAFKLFCEKGRLWLKSDADKESKDWKAPLKDSDNDAEFKQHAIVIEAGKGSILSHAKGSNVVSSAAEDNYGSSLDEKKDKEYKDTKLQGVILSGKRVNVVGETVFTKAMRIVSSSTEYIRKAASAFMYLKEMIWANVFTLKGNHLRGKLTASLSGSVMAKAGFTGPSEKVRIASQGVMEKACELDKEIKDLSEDKEEELDGEIKEINDGTVWTYEWKDGKEDEWRFRKWTVGTKADNWASLKASPVHLTLSKGGYVNSKQFKQVAAAAVDKVEGEHVNSEYLPWPGRKAKMFSYNMAYGDTLAPEAKTDFKAGHIGGWSNMKKGAVTTFMVADKAEKKDLVQ